MAITPLPDAPLTTDNPVVFNTKAFAWVASLGTFTTQANALAIDVSTDALAADASKIDAQAAAASAVAAANATKWASGTSYAEGAVVWSPITFLSYRRKTAGSGTTDPSLDSTNWAQVAGTGDVTTDGVQTLTNKTIAFGSNTLTDVASTNTTQTLTNKTVEKIILNDGYTEEVFAITDGSTVDLDPNNGSVQTWTLGANRTPDQANWAAGQSITLMIDDGTAYAITWTTLAVEWKTGGGTAPELNTTGFTVITLWKVGTTIYGARVGDA
jgi:hypothetical protein